MQADAGASCALQHAGHREGHAIPALAMLLELPLAGGCEAVVLGAPVVLSAAPFGFELAVLLEAVERGKQRSRVDAELIVTERGQPLRDAVAVHRLAGE